MKTVFRTATSLSLLAFLCMAPSVQADSGTQVDVEHFDVSGGYMPRLLSGRFTLKNTSDTALSNVKVQVHVRDGYGHAVPGAVVEARPQGSSDDAIAPGTEKVFSWMWNGYSGVRVFKSPELTISGTAPSGPFELDVLPTHADVSVPGTGYWYR